MTRGVKFRSLIPRCVALGADPRSFLRGGVNYPSAASKCHMKGEHAEQAIVTAVCRSAGVRFFHVPNGGRMSQVQCAEFKCIGMEKGVPDLWFPFHRIVIEMKSPAKFAAFGKAKQALCKVDGIHGLTAKEDAGQRGWIESLRSAGWKVPVCYTADDAVALLRREGVL